VDYVDYDYELKALESRETETPLTLTLTPNLFRLRNDLYCVELGVKLYSLTRHLTYVHRIINVL